MTVEYLVHYEKLLADLVEEVFDNCVFKNFTYQYNIYHVYTNKIKYKEWYFGLYQKVDLGKRICRIQTYNSDDEQYKRAIKIEYSDNRYFIEYKKLAEKIDETGRFGQVRLTECTKKVVSDD